MAAVLRWFAVLAALPLAACLSQRTSIECQTCKREPYVAVSDLAFETQWGALCTSVGLARECEDSSYEVTVRCVTPCETGECELACEHGRNTEGSLSVVPTVESFTGQIAVEITLRKPGVAQPLHYRSPMVWYSNEGMVLVCVAPGTAHALVPCGSQLSAQRPQFAIAYERTGYFTGTSWRLLDRALINGRLVSATSSVSIGDEDVPVFSLRDVFAPFREPAGGIKPAVYSFHVATPPGPGTKADRKFEVTVR